ncbi:MAG TPA: tRNA (adenosine(37)-N6)-threonylcarbamoyltransferase complex ATPase subunit type 1 TsaE [Clostridiales bacterium]|jgi:tRNA threonylcarbamoyladenosine biosynthesis protein TsaE|nr:tRNA (adenosine(37)-N6)-threonylcarbamoyltransferase complex ATPase subunit type 1 TsaE [Clostridiales bacterium]
MVFTTHKESETENLGRRLALAARSTPLVVCLLGDLGAGKTVFVRGMAKAFGFAGRVTSPTFAIVNEYNNAQGKPVLLHFDMYRLSSSEELYDIGWYDYLEMGAAIAVEWAEKVMDAMPENAVFVAIEGAGMGPRTITLTGLSKEEELLLEKGCTP